jgi:CubicO group peptidase (beta-lactamase class C family)
MPLQRSNRWVLRHTPATLLSQGEPDWNGGVLTIETPERQINMHRRQFLQGVLSAPIISSGWKKGPPSSFETELLQMMGVAPVPGAVIGVVQNGSPAWFRPLGFSSLETKTPVTRETLFQAASLTKQVIAYAAFALREQGKLDFDRTLVSYVDDLPDESARQVTLRHVLSHSSGFPNWRSEAGNQLVPEFAPGSRFQYSGEGFFYLQRILEHITGRGLCEIVDDMVFKPLGMTSSSMIWKPELADRYALPHDRRGELRKNWDKTPKRLHEIAKQRGQTVTAWRYADYESATREAGDPALPNLMLPNGAASLVTNAPDYARFLAAAIRNPDIGKEQIRIRPSLGWGLGWGIERVGAREYVWQWGDNGGYKNFAVAEPARGVGVFVFTNGDSGARVYDRVVTHATGHDHPALFWV